MPVMKTAAIFDALQDDTTGALLEELLKEKGHSCTRFRLRDLDIKPCRSCGSCGEKTPGRCVQNDDMEPLFRAIANSDMLVFLSGISFGMYSAQMKKAVDRLMAIGYPLYTMKKGHILHPMRYEGKSLFIIGTVEDRLVEGEEENFRLLAERNSLNFQYPYRVTVLHPGDDIETTLREILTGPERAVPY
jgi:multimeric flavodoxin WrbA